MWACSFSFLAYGEASEEALNNIVATFEQSVEQKNKEKFLHLFVKQPVSWVGVYHEQDYQNELNWAKSAEAVVLKKQLGDKFVEPAKVRFSTPEIFIDSIIDNTNQTKEKLSNVVIESDGEVATINFDYQFFDGGKQVNHGNENWQLIRTLNGWKINAVNYSIVRG